MAVKITWENNDLVYVDFSGTVSNQELLLPNNKIIGDPRFDRLKAILVRLDTVKVFDIRPQDLVILAALDKGASRWNDRIRLALVGQQPHVLEFINTYMQLMEDFIGRIQHFEQEDKALEWSLELK